MNKIDGLSSRMIDKFYLISSKTGQFNASSVVGKPGEYQVVAVTNVSGRVITSTTSFDTWFYIMVSFFVALLAVVYKHA